MHVEAVAAWAARGAEVASDRPTAPTRGGGRCPSHRGVAARAWVRGGRDTRPWAASGPCHYFFQNFKTRTNFIIQIGDLPDVQYLPNFAGR
jgi:hypothetical protein